MAQGVQKRFQINNLKWLWVTLTVLVLDQASKLVVLSQLKLYQSIKLLPFFNITLVYNEGIAFSFLNRSGPWQELFLITIALIACCLIVTMTLWVSSKKRLLLIALTLILGGAVGNLADRLYHGYVIDFIDLHAAGWHWPAFNVADSAITVGALFLIIDIFTPESDHQ